MNLEVRYSTHPDDSKHYTTEELRKHYYWIPSNSELLEADNKIKAQNGSF